MKLYRVSTWGDLTVVDGQPDGKGNVRIGTFFHTFAEAKDCLVTRIRARIAIAEMGLDEMKNQLAVAQKMEEPIATETPPTRQLRSVWLRCELSPDRFRGGATGQRPDSVTDHANGMES